MFDGKGDSTGLTNGSSLDIMMCSDGVFYTYHVYKGFLLPIEGVYIDTCLLLSHSVCYIDFLV